MPGPVFLDGDRVALRTLEREDLDLVQRSRNDPAIREWMTFTEPASMDDVEEFYENVVLGDDNLNLVICVSQPSSARRDTDGERGADAGQRPASVDDEPAGVVVLFDVGRHAAELAAWLLPEYRGEGYGKAAAELLVGHGFEGLGLHRIRAKALRDNDASRATMESLGFEEVGVARDAVFQRGDYRDMVRYDLLADDWFRERE